jgi:glycogen phosphorylase
MFYERHVDGLPRKWIGRMKTSISQLCRFFTTHRMVGEYTTGFYIPGATHQRRMVARGMERAKSLASWKAKASAAWPHLSVISVSEDHPAEIPVGSGFNVGAEVRLGELTPDDVSVELYMGVLNAEGEIVDGHTIPMHPEKRSKRGTTLYRADQVICSGSGRYGYTVRLLPKHPDLVTPFLPGMITWAQE